VIASAVVLTRDFLPRLSIFFAENNKPLHSVSVGAGRREREGCCLVALEMAKITEHLPIYFATATLFQ